MPKSSKYEIDPSELTPYAIDPESGYDVPDSELTPVDIDRGGWGPAIQSSIETAIPGGQVGAQVRQVWKRMAGMEPSRTGLERTLSQLTPYFAGSEGGLAIDVEGGGKFDQAELTTPIYEGVKGLGRFALSSLEAAGEAMGPGVTIDDWATKTAGKLLDAGVLAPDEEYQKRAQEKGTAVRFIESAAGIGPQMGMQYAIARIPGAGPVLSSVFMATQIAGAEYESMVKEGIDPMRAGRAAWASAFAQLPMEVIGMMGGMVPGSQSMAGKIIGGAVGEGFTEFAQTFPSEFFYEWAKDPQFIDEVKKDPVKMYKMVRTLVDFNNFAKGRKVDGEIPEGTWEAFLESRPDLDIKDISDLEPRVFSIFRKMAKDGAMEGAVGALWGGLLNMRPPRAVRPNLLDPALTEDNIVDNVSDKTTAQEVVDNAWMANEVAEQEDVPDEQLTPVDIEGPPPVQEAITPGAIQPGVGPVEREALLTPPPAETPPPPPAAPAVDVEAEPAPKAEPTSAVSKQEEFDSLWKQLPPEEQKRLADIPVDNEMSIDEKIQLVQAEMATIGIAPKAAEKVEEKPTEKAQTEDDVMMMASREFEEGGLNVTEYEGVKGNRQHITRVERGTISPEKISHLKGEMGEVRGDHRNRKGKAWEEFKESIRKDGIKEPIFILKDPGKEAVVSEGNHRLDAALELGLKEVPVEVRYFGKSESEGLAYKDAKSAGSKAQVVATVKKADSNLKFKVDGFGSDEPGSMYPAGTAQITPVSRGPLYGASISVPVDDAAGAKKKIQEAREEFEKGLTLSTWRKNPNKRPPEFAKGIEGKKYIEGATGKNQKRINRMIDEAYQAFRKSIGMDVLKSVSETPPPLPGETTPPLPGETPPPLPMEAVRRAAQIVPSRLRTPVMEMLNMIESYHEDMGAKPGDLRLSENIPKTWQNISEAARAAGIRLVFADIKGDAIQLQAAQTGIPGVILVNSATDADPILVVAHEVLHDIQVNHPDIWADLQEQLDKYIKKEEVKKWLERRKDLTAMFDKKIEAAETKDEKARLKRKRKDVLKKEFYASAVADVVTERGFWNRLFENAPDAAKVFMRKLQSILSKLIARNPKARYFTNAKRAQLAYAEAYAKYLNRVKNKKYSDFTNTQSDDVFLMQKEDIRWINSESPGGWEGVDDYWYSTMYSALEQMLPKKASAKDISKMVNSWAGPPEELNEQIGDLEKERDSLKLKGGKDADARLAEIKKELKKVRKQASKFKGAFKREELDWSGLPFILEVMGDKKISKEDLLKWIEANQLDLEVVQYGRVNPAGKQLSFEREEGTNLTSEAESMEMSALLDMSPADPNSPDAIALDQIREDREDPNYGPDSEDWDQDLFNSIRENVARGLVIDMWRMGKIGHISFIDTEGLGYEIRKDLDSPIYSVYDPDGNYLGWEDTLQSAISMANENTIVRYSEEDDDTRHVLYTISRRGTRKYREYVFRLNGGVNKREADRVRLKLIGLKEEFDKLSNEESDLKAEIVKLDEEQEKALKSNDADKASEIMAERVKVHNKRTDKGVEAAKINLKIQRASERLAELTNGVFTKSAHWGDLSNFFAHARVSEATGPDGNEMFFVEEVQSDLHSEVSSVGYKYFPDQDPVDLLTIDDLEFVRIPKDKYKEHQVYKEMDEIQRKVHFQPLPEGVNEYVLYRVKTPIAEKHGLTEGWSSGHGGSSNEEIFRSVYERTYNFLKGIDPSAPTVPTALATSRINMREKATIDMPFKKSWPLLVFKKMIREAIDMGYDKIGWAAGWVHANRWRLAQAIGSVSYYKNPRHLWVSGSVGPDIDLESGAVASKHKDMRPTWNVRFFDKNNSNVNDKVRRVSGFDPRALTEQQIKDLGGDVLFDLINEKKGEKDLPEEEAKRFKEALEKYRQQGNITDTDAAEKRATYEQRLLKTKDLDVTPKWPFNIYDKQLPNVLNKYFGKDAWGKPKIEFKLINPNPDTVTGYKYEKVGDEFIVYTYRHDEDAAPIEHKRFDSFGAMYRWAGSIASRWQVTPIFEMEITPEMKARASNNGFPLFSKAPIDEEYIVTPAIRYNGQIFAGETHLLAAEKFKKIIGKDIYEIGFENMDHNGYVTNTGRFITKDEALEMAAKKRDREAVDLDAKTNFTVAKDGTMTLGESSVPKPLNAIAAILQGGRKYKISSEAEVPIFESLGFKFDGRQTMTFKGETYDPSILAGGYEAIWGTRLGFERGAKEVLDELRLRYLQSSYGGVDQRALDDLEKGREEYLKRSWATYSAGQEEPGYKNVFVKRGPKSDTLMVQISSNLGNVQAQADGEFYFDMLYENREGYKRPNDFWEIPFWAAEAADVFKKSDFYVVRNIEEAIAFLNDSEYDRVLFSAMDANKQYIKRIVDEYPGRVLVGGYVPWTYFARNRNVIFVDSMESAAKLEGLECKGGIDYSIFKGTGTIPRLEMSRGCKHHCAFCTVPKEVTPATKKGIDKQVKGFKGLDYELVYLNDKTFGQAENFKDLERVYKKIKRQNKKFKGFIIQTTAPAFLKMDPEFIKKAGIKFVEMGVETYNDDILKKLKKPHNTKLIDQAVAKVRELELQLVPNVMVGLAGATYPKEIDKKPVYYRGSMDKGLRRRKKRGAYYFTRDVDYAKQYGSFIQGYHIDVKKTWDYRDPKSMDKSIQKMMEESYETGGFKISDLKDRRQAYADWSVIESPEIQSALKKKGYDSYVTHEVADALAVFKKENVTPVDAPVLWTETKETYNNTLEFLEANKGVISHVNVYTLAVYEGTDVADQLGKATETDADENMVQRSWMKDRELHENFYRDVLEFGARQLTPAPEIEQSPETVMLMAEYDDQFEKTKDFHLGRDDVVNMAIRAGGHQKLAKYLKGKGWSKKDAERMAHLAKTIDEYPFPPIEETVKKIIEHDKNFPEDKRWYENSLNFMRTVVDNEDDFERMRSFALLSWLSMNKGTLGNMLEFVKIRSMIAAEGVKSIEGATLADFEIMENLITAKKIEEMFEVGRTGLGWKEGHLKVKAFAETFVALMNGNDNLRAAVDSVLDIWMARYFYPTRYADNDIRKTSQLRPVDHDRIQHYMREVERRLSDQTGFKWYPDMAQAALWFVVRDEWKKAGLAEAQTGHTFDEAIRILAARWAGVDNAEDIPDEVVRAFIKLKLRDPGVRHVLDRYKLSDKEYKVVMPEFQGKGLPGAEWTKQEYLGYPRPRRIHFYERGKVPEKQFAHGIRQRTVIDSSRIYDIAKDELRYKKLAGPNFGGQFSQEGLLAMEKKIVEDGWVGLQNGGVTVLFEPTRVHRMRKAMLGVSPMADPDAIEKLSKVQPKQAAKLKWYQQLVKDGDYKRLYNDVKNELATSLRHPLIDIKEVYESDGRWEGGNEWAISPEVEYGDLDIMKGVFAEFLMNHAQFEGIISEIKSEVGTMSRPEGVPKQQAPSILLVFKKGLDNKMLEKISGMMGAAGIGGSSYIPKIKTLVVHHIMYRTKGKLDQTPAAFKNAAAKLIADVAAAYPDHYQGYSHIWMKHHIMKNNWTDEKVKSGPGRYAPDGEVYANAIKRGQDKSRDLGIIGWPSYAQGESGENLPVLSAKPSNLAGKTSSATETERIAKNIGDLIKSTSSYKEAKKKKGAEPTLSDVEKERQDRWKKMGIRPKDDDPTTGGDDVLLSISPEAAKVIAKRVGATERSLYGKVIGGIDEFWQNRYTRVFDRLNPIKDHLGGEGVPYMLARGVPGVQSTLNAFLFHGLLQRDANEGITVTTRNQGFVPWLRSLGQDAEKFFYWLIVKRAEALEKEGRENWLLKPDREKLLAWIGKKPVTRNSWGDINREFQVFNDNIREFGITSGLFSKQQVDKWMKDFYIPFYRVFEDPEAKAEFVKSPTRSRQFISAQIKRLKGGEAKLGDPINNAIRNWSNIIATSMENDARRLAYQYAADNKIKSEIPYVDPKTGATKFRDLVEEVSWADTVIFKPSKKNENLVFVHKKTGEQILSFMKDGKSVFFRVNDPELFGALANINREYFNNAVLKMMGAAKHALTYGATFGPAFRVANMIRDTLHTFLISKSFVPFWDTAKGIVKVLRQDEDYVNFMASGHAFSGSYIRAEDPHALRKFTNRIIKREGQKAGSRILDTPRKMLEFWEMIGHASENAARVSLYSNLKKKGKTHLEAAFAARDLMDFQLSGNSDIVRFMIQVIPFLNARGQGLYKMGRAAKQNPGAFMTKGAMIAAASLALWLAYYDDDRYKELEEWEKWAYYHFWIGDKHYRIPKPFETGVIFSSLFEATGNVMSGKEDIGHMLRFLKHATMETFAFNPIFGVQAIKPLAEQWANRVEFTGRPIEGLALQRLNPGERFDPWTSETLQVLGRINLQNGKLAIPPKRAEHLIRGYFGTLGMFILGVSDIFARNIFDFPEKPDERIESYPLVGRFIREANVSRNTRYMSHFYDTFNELSQLVSTINHYEKLEDYDKAKELVEDNRARLALWRQYGLARRELSKVNKDIRLVWSRDNMTGDEKRKRLDELYQRRNEIVRDIYNKYQNRKEK